MSGNSLACYDSFVAALLGCGSKYRTLSEYAFAATSTRRSCASTVAFRGCVSSVLDAIETHATMKQSQIRSMLQLQRLADRPHQLLGIIKMLADSVSDQTTDEAVISVFSEEVHRIVCSGSIFTETLQEMLVRVSRPWLERLCADLGLQRDRMSEQLVSFEENTQEPNDESTISFVGRATQSQRLPAFVSAEDGVLVLETKRSLQLLRQYLPSHKLDVHQSTATWEQSLAVSESTPALHDIIYGGMRSMPTNMETADLSEYDDFESAAGEVDECSVWNEGLAWSGDEEQRTYLESLDARISHPLRRFPQDRLSQLVTSAFASSLPDAISSGEYSLLGADFNPLQQLRPIIQGHAAHINRTILRYLFRDCRLRHHLDLQRQFHLFSNGDFVSRLTAAPFSADTQFAERKRGKIPTGETMGLRLGVQDGQRWPPASSEIQLTLMGILTETYHPEFAKRGRMSNIKDLPGGLSFSVRELPESEIEKVMDPNSIHALDFLKLQYTAVPPLDAIITPTAMQGYDNIFRFLLKLLRVLHVTMKLRQRFSSDKEHDKDQTGSPSSVRLGFAIGSHHYMSVLMSHFMDVGIAATWTRFMVSLKDVENTLHLDSELDGSKARNMIGLDGLRQLHETCVEDMRRKLFLRRKQQKLRSAVEEFLSAILRCAAASEDTTGTVSQADYANFRDALTRLLSLLRAIVDKPLKADNVDETSDDVENLKILLFRLNWNGTNEIATNG